MEAIKKREQILGIAFFISFLIGGIPLSNMLRRAWETRGVTWHLYYGAPFDASILGLFFIGIFFGLVLLMMVDVYKRMVGGILCVAGVLALSYLYFQGRVQFNYISGSFLFAIGAYLGMLIGGGLWRPKKFVELYEEITDSEEIPEYPRAAIGLLILMLLIVLFALIEIHVNYQSGIVASGGGGYRIQDWAIKGLSTEGIAKNILVSSLFLFALAYVAQYERKKDIAIVGSKRAGKTTLAAGLGYYIRNQKFETLIDDQEEMPYQAAEVETGNINELLINESGGEEGSSIGEGTVAEMLRTVSLTYIKGRRFPYNISINSLDYSGEHINEIVNPTGGGQTKGENEETSTDEGTGLRDARLSNIVRQKRVEKLLPDEGQVRKTPQKVREKLIKLFNYSDTLVIILPFDLVYEYDMDDLPDWYENISDAYTYEKGMLGDYSSIVSDFNNKEIAVIVTKCDYMIYNEGVGFPEDTEDYVSRASEVNSDTTVANGGTKVYTDGDAGEWQDNLSHHLIEKDEVYEEFITKTIDEMTKNPSGARDIVQEILAAAGGDARVYPVYFQPNKDNPVEGGDINIVQSDGSVRLVGAKQLLDRLGEG
jgi:hypothetical protein